MRIKTIKISNFRCFENIEINFENCHALIGENGSGKTTILEAIDYATSPSYPYLNEQDFNSLDKGDLSIEVIFDKPFLVKIPDSYVTQHIPCQSILLSAHRRERQAPGKALSSPFVVEKYVIPITYESTSDVEFLEDGTLEGDIPSFVRQTSSGYESPRRNGSTFKFTKRRLGMQNDMVNFPNVFYFDRDREREAKVGFNSLLTKIAKDLNWRFRKDWDQEEVSKKWEAFYESVINTVIPPKNDRIMGPLHKKLKEIAGANFPDLELSLLEIEEPFTKAFFSRRDGTNQIEQKKLGSGISILIGYFLLEIISKLSKGKIIFLIDEPELHLHPQLQQNLFKEFVDSDHQIIYSTQSDCFIDVSKWKSISRFQPDFSITPQKVELNTELEGRKIREHLDEIKKWHQHKSVFFREDNQIFFSRKCLLVEGPADKYCIPVIAKKLDLELGDITILSCNGKSKIPYYQLLCKAFKIPFFTVFDLDGKDSNDTENKRPYTYSEKEALEVFETSFERILGIEENTEHKISKLFIKVDDMSLEEIPEVVKEVIEKISGWSRKC